MADEGQGSPQDRAAPRAGASRLPPPAFPPGQRAQPQANHRPPTASPEGTEGQVPDDAFIFPDAPLRGLEDQAEEGIVTGIGGDAHLGHDDLALSQGGDPVVADLAQRVGRLAEGLRIKGEAALRTTRDMSKFETTLRAYCVGYLAAQRDNGNT